MNILEFLKELYWKNLFLNEQKKEKIFYFIKGQIKGQVNTKTLSGNILEKYITQILDIQNFSNAFSIDYPVIDNNNNNNNNFLEKNDIKLLAYYLPQYYPNKYNNQWWGKGTTEWTNVSKAMPQYLGQLQPKLPGELGYYDLRIQENIYRQIELAKIYGIYGFCFYYYWFDGVRLLDLPFDNFVNDKAIDFPFCIAWINESWTKQWDGNSNTPLIKISDSPESYREFIKVVCHLFEKENYIRINNKPILIIYRPLNIPKIDEIINYWRNYVRQNLNEELYIIGSVHTQEVINMLDKKQIFDMLSEFAPGPQIEYMQDITKNKKYLCETFYGKVYDYKEFVKNKNYFKVKGNKLFRAVSPMWDNTARKRNKGIILDGSTPELYKQWLKDIIIETKNNKDLDDNIIFINAWNEWAEGAYLEPDLKWQYGYLEATRQAIIETI